MHATLHSSHVTHDFSDGELAIDIVTDDARRGISRHDRVRFAVPRDYHVHNDAVAAALLTLLGRTCSQITFNFPISEHCAALLTSYYSLAQVGPIDPTLEPRQPGRQFALNFSGGTDSTALYLLLQDVLGDDFKVITSDFGGRFVRERSGFQTLRRDITCRTNLRQRGYDEHGRFIAAVPLLFADYLDLGRVASGHGLLQENVTIARRTKAHTPDYRAKEPVYLAGGLREEHIVRGLSSHAILRIILQRAPERLEGAFTASAYRNTEKYYSRMLVVRGLCQELGLPLPAFLEGLPQPQVLWPHIAGQRYSLVTMYALKYLGIAEARAITANFEQFDFSYLDGMTLEFLKRYNTNVVDLLPDDLRPAVLNAFHAYDIYPYQEHDWRELDVVREKVFEPGALE
jgi:hypothetical protein